MTTVKEASDEPAGAPADALADIPVATLLGRLLRGISRTLSEQDWDGLRPSHLRLMSEVPPQGIRITDLGERLGMTKQASGQFVAQLVDTGHLVVRADPGDRRSRIAVRTAAGERMVAAAAAHIERIEDEWAARVGSRRYQQFRAVVEELATGG